MQKLNPFLKLQIKTQRDVALAKIHGWTEIEDANSMMMGGHWVGYPPLPAIPIIGEKEPIPNYSDDLNAIHELVNRSLSLAQLCKYAEELHRLTVKPYDDVGAVTACAESRAEIILKICGKWETDEEIMERLENV